MLLRLNSSVKLCPQTAQKDQINPQKLTSKSSMNTKHKALHISAAAEAKTPSLFE